MFRKIEKEQEGYLRGYNDASRLVLEGQKCECPKTISSAFYDNECPVIKYSECSECVECQECEECPETEVVKEKTIIYPHNGNKMCDSIIDKFGSLYLTMLLVNPFDYEEGVYDCTDYSRDFVLSLRDKGIDSAVVHGYIGDSTTSHAWVGIFIEATTGKFVKNEDNYRVKGIRTINEDGTITNYAKR